MEMEDEENIFSGMTDDEVYEIFQLSLKEMCDRGLSRVAEHTYQTQVDEAQIAAEYIARQAKQRVADRMAADIEAQAAKQAAEVTRRVQEIQSMVGAAGYQAAIAWLDRTAPEWRSTRAKPSLSLWMRDDQARVYFDGSNGWPPYDSRHEDYFKVTYFHTASGGKPAGTVEIKIFPEAIADWEEAQAKEMCEKLRLAGHRWGEFCQHLMADYPGQFRLYASAYLDSQMPCDRGLLAKYDNILVG